MKMKNVLPLLTLAALSLLLLFAGCDTGVSGGKKDPEIISQFPDAPALLLPEATLGSYSITDTADWYELIADDDYINIELIPEDDSAVMELTLYDRFGAVLETSSAENENYISYGPVCDGTYYLKVERTDGDSPVDYDLWWNTNPYGD